MIPKPALAPPPLRHRRPRAGLWQGVIRRPKSLLAYVKAAGQQVAQSFPLDTPLTEIQKWRADQRDELHRQTPAKGTLAGDIDAHLATLDGRRRIDANSWLKRWKASSLGSKPRARITREDIATELERFKAEGYAGASLNHLRQSLISLWRSLDGPGHTCPARLVPKYPSSHPRQGFFEADAIEKVLKELPQHYRDVVEFAYFSGWRRQEIQGLLWSEIDRSGGVIRLSPERSKTRDGRVLPIIGPIAEIIERRAAQQRRDLPWVFWRTVGSRTRRRTAARYVPIGDWRKAWHKATKAAGCQGALLHDLRRTVVRNLTRARVPEKVAMAWTGHKTRSVFDRYNIVCEEDLVAAGRQLAAHIRKPEPADNSG